MDETEITTDHPRSKRRRELAVLVAVPSVLLTLTFAAIAASTSAADAQLVGTAHQAGKITALEAGPAVSIDLSRLETTPVTVAPTTTVPPPPPAPAPAPKAAPAPTVPPAPPASSSSVLDAIATWFPDVYDKAVAVADCESSLNPSAVSPGGGNWGLFQINRVHEGLVNSMGYSWDQILDPYVNSEVARHIYNDSGWSAWSCG